MGRSRRGRSASGPAVLLRPTLVGVPAIDRPDWPALPYADWKDTLDAVHLWTQIVGKIRMAFTPLMNHWWNSTLYVSPRGLTTSLIPLANDAFQIELDFVEHELVITSRGTRESVRVH